MSVWLWILLFLAVLAFVATFLLVADLRDERRDHDQWFQQQLEQWRAPHTEEDPS